MTVAALRPKAPERGREDPFEDRLVKRVMGYVRMADVGEEQRRKHDRLGAKLYYGQHYSRPMPDDRAAIVANLGMAIIRHKAAIMTKSDPIPVISPDDVGDERAARRMNLVIQKIWKADGMRQKSRRLVIGANCMRTCALKVLWDPTLKGGAGDITTDNILPWNLIVDNQVQHPRAMEYCGHRASMARSRAMLSYPDAADKIREMNQSENGARKQTPLSGSGSPVSTPWKSSVIPFPGAAVINGKPVVTAFAGELNSDTPGVEYIDVIEMYHKDHTIEFREEPVRDALGSIKKEIDRDDDGMPQFEEADPELHQMGDGSHVMLPRFRLKMKEMTELVPVRKYPHWRRTTVAISMGEGVLLEDIAWDRRLPIILYTDLEPLDGILGRGSLLQCEHLQALINVGLSSITDEVRFGALCAWLAGTSAGVTQTQIIPGIGQVIPVNDITQIKPVEVEKVDPAFFTLFDRAVNLMERILGATGVMQGESTGRVDSAAGYDTLAEIGGSTLVECTQRLESAISEWASVVGEFAQEFYDERHAIAVEENEGQVTWERVSGPLLQGSFSYDIATGSTMAWSESAKQQRSFQEYQAGIIDRQQYYEDTHKPNYRQILERITAALGPIAALGPVAAPPKKPGAKNPPRPGSKQKVA